MSGRVHLSLNNIKEAKQQFKIAVRDVPEYPISCYTLGILYTITGKIKKAISHEKAIALNSNLTSTWINLGTAYCKLKDYQKSV